MRLSHATVPVRVCMASCAVKLHPCIRTTPNTITSNSILGWTVGSSLKEVLTGERRTIFPTKGTSLSQVAHLPRAPRRFLSKEGRRTSCKDLCIRMPRGRGCNAPPILSARRRRCAHCVKPVVIHLQHTSSTSRGLFMSADLTHQVTEEPKSLLYLPP